MPEQSYREYMCKLVHPGCEFKIRAKTDDEVIELAHMHQKIAHDMKERSPDTERNIKQNIRSIKID